jgi:glycosyltransferase involved in cell wall biosynthesis
MKILLVNKFFYFKGGSEYCFFDTACILQERGHNVCFLSVEHPENIPLSASKYFVSRVDFETSGGFLESTKTSGKILYSFEAKKNVKSILKKEIPDLCHLHNIYHQISPSIIHILKKRGISIIMTLHDYKMVCPIYTLYFNGKVCERCKNGRYYWCLINCCTKGSYAKSALNVLEMYLHHKLLHIYELVDVFISPSQFLKEKLKEMGFNGRTVYLPNFVDIDAFVPFYVCKEKAIYYAGRLSEEKGLFTLVEAVKGLDVKLIIIGDGPLRGELEKRKNDNTYFTGYMPQQELKKVAGDCMAMVIPSEWYENNPRSILEAFAIGKPVIGARIGGITELVIDNVTGYTFEPGNAEDLREEIKFIIANSLKAVEMGKNARRFVQENFNPEKHYQGLMEIYQMAQKKLK